MTLVWESEANVHCIIEHHQGYLYLFTDAAIKGQPVDHHYLLYSPVASSCSPRNWEVRVISVINHVSMHGPGLTTSLVMFVLCFNCYLKIGF